MDVQPIANGELPLLGAALVILLGLAVLLARPVRRVQWAFAVYAVCFGLSTGASQLHVPGDAFGTGLLWTAVMVLAPVAGIALVAVAVIQGGRPTTRQAVALSLPGFGILVVGLGLLAARAETGPQAVQTFGTTWAPTVPWGWGAFFVLMVFGGAAAVLFALRARDATEPELRSAALMSTAFAIYPSFFPTGFLLLSNAFFIAAGLVGLVVTLWICVVWLGTTTRCQDPALARRAALWPVGFALAGLLAGALGVPGTAGIARILTVVVLAYAILRHHALGIDAKLRFGISKTTVAAVFISVFFIASEAAQTFFGERLQNEYVGIVAAGALVFAIAPLSRVADGLAARAVPHAASVARAAAPDHRGAVQHLAARLAADGWLSPEDRRALAVAGEAAGLGAVELHDVITAAEARAREARARA